MIIDVSSYQGKIDWDKVKATPELGGVYIKASEGVNAPDKDFAARIHEVSAKGLSFGFYHFATLNKQDVVSDAISEATYFMQLVHPYKATLPYALDIESNPAKLPPDKVLLYIKTFFDTLKKAGIEDYCLYSYTPFLNANLPANHDLGPVKLWLASYTPKYVLPRGWQTAWLWQYTQAGFINGIKGNVDISKIV